KPASAALAETESAYELVLDRYRSGLADYVSVLIAENRLFARRLAVSRLAGLQLESEVDVIRALGGGYVAPPHAGAAR
ncbi:MAG TPA: fusaric acid resistance protein, partial [Gammaproteobacteria bacterium]|nr:fusaric acid resistance protein [Gammaproteobacteria bacterium]